MSDLYKVWLLKQTSVPPLQHYLESEAGRVQGFAELRTLIAEHFVGEVTIMQMGGYEQAADTIKNSLPTNKQTQSGDLAELLATEYLNDETSFRVVIRKLKWKDDAQTAMRGNDIIGLERTGARIRVLKGECKSRQSFSPATLAEAIEDLERHDGRPNPSTLAFITKRLYEQNQDADANIFRSLQASGALVATDIVHLVFVLSGDDPSHHFASMPQPNVAGMTRQAALVVVPDHAELVSAAFDMNGTTT